MTRQELLNLVDRISHPSSMTEEQLGELVDDFESAIPHPAGTDLLYYPQYWGLGSSPTTEEIVHEALGWRPRILAMPVTYVRKHPNNDNLLIYGVELPGRIKTQIVSPLRLTVGNICSVALSGVRLKDGEEVRHGFIDRVYSAGKILGLTQLQPGTEIT